MPRHCELCGQDYCDDLQCCPRCRAEQEAAASVAQPSWATVALSTAPDAHIDLGSPVTSDPGPNGPPSGGSFISWTALLRRRNKGVDVASAPSRLPRFAIPPAAGQATAPPQAQQDRMPARNARLFALFVGFLLGCAFCLALWSVGAEPPHAWRQGVWQWLANDSESRPHPARNPSSAE
jgi:hypothetical protein